MPISVVCPGCKARFSVSEKFAGKQGPCPKCKVKITIPAAQEEVKIHVPEEFASGGRDSTGRPTSKPIARRETKAKPIVIGGIFAAALAVLITAFLLRGLSADAKLPVIIAGLVVLSPPLTVAGYSFLRNDELEGYSGKWLWLRAGICSLVYILLWGGYWILPPDLIGETYQWLIAGPIFISIGAGAAWACFDLDFGSGALHYSFYLLVTLLLRAAIGMPPIWN